MENEPINTRIPEYLHFVPLHYCRLKCSQLGLPHYCFTLPIRACFLVCRDLIYLVCWLSTATSHLMGRHVVRVSRVVCQRLVSSVGQSVVLITRRSQVRNLYRAFFIFIFCEETCRKSLCVPLHPLFQVLIAGRKPNKRTYLDPRSLWNRRCSLDGQIGPPN